MSSETEWRWADPNGQQRLIRTDELLAALAHGVIPSNAPVWKKGWANWLPANETPELMSSALAAENGVVPNIPPPPLFVVAAQAAYEGPPISESQLDAGPPPPPRYVPAAATPPSSSKTGTLSPPANAMGVPPPNAPVQKSEPTAERKMISKRTVMGLAPVAHAIAMEPPKPAASPAPPAATSSSTLVEGRPRIAAAQEANTAVNLLKDSEPRKLDSPKTVIGVPSIEDPRARRVPSTPPPVQVARSTPPMPSGVENRDGDTGKSAKRQTLILYGGAPSAESPPPASTAPVEHAPPIVVPGPGTQAGKNAVTRPPPWGEGAVAIGPAIPKSAPTPRVGGEPRAKQDSAEELSGSVLLDSLVDDDDPPAKPETRARSVPPPLKPRSLPPPAPKRPTPNVQRPSDQGGFQLGAPPVVPAEDTAPDALPPLPIESLYERVRRISKTNYDLASGKLGRVAQERLPGAKAKIDKFAEGKPKFLVPVAGGLSILVLFIFVGATVNALRACGSDEKDKVATDPVTPFVSVVPANPVSPTRPSPVAETPSSPCLVAGPSKTLATHALVPSGVEVVPFGSSVALGFATGPKEGEVIQLDPSKLTVGKDARLHASDPLRRVTPLAAEGKPLAGAGDIDHKADKLQGRRTILSASPVDLGVADGSLVWAAHGTDKSAVLWALTGDGPAEALRGAPLDGSEKGVAIAFRHASAIWLGAALGDGKTLAPRGALSSVPGLGPQVGSPAIAASGGWIFAVWADRTGASEPWGLRWLRWKSGEAAPETPHAFTPPPGGLGAPIMSPGVAGIGGGRFLVVWTEGPVSAHQVRAQTVDASGAFQGDALTISPDGANAGQGQPAVTSDGKGVVAYLSSSGKNYEVVATPISCPR